MHETRYDSENQFNLLRRAEACVFSCCSQDLGEFQLLRAFVHCDRPEKREDCQLIGG